MPRGHYKRTEYHRRRVQEGWIKRKQNQASKPDKFNGFNSRIENLDKDELIDKLASLKYKILEKVKELGRNLKTLQNLQEERDKIEIRLEELGMRFKDQ